MLFNIQPVPRAWNRMKSAMSFGDCLVTISTAPSVEDKIRIRDERGRLIGLSVEDEEITGLVPSHAYAVLDVQELCGLRLLKVFPLINKLIVAIIVVG